MRSHTYEREFLEHVARQAGLSGDAERAFLAAVERRLAKGAEEYGDDNFWRRGFDWVVRNAREEGEDISGWVLGAAQVLNDEVAGGFSAEAAQLIQLHLMRAAARGMEAWMLLEQAHDLYRHHRDSR